VVLFSLFWQMSWYMMKICNDHFRWTKYTACSKSINCHCDDACTLLFRYTACLYWGVCSSERRNPHHVHRVSYLLLQEKTSWEVQNIEVWRYQVWNVW
jgi:hypothetical protein